MYPAPLHLPTSDTERLPPAIERALRIGGLYWPEESSRAAHTLPLVLSALSQGDAAWQRSRLTEDGFPAEFTFTSTGSGLRYTAEVAPPDYTPAARLDQALALLARLDAPALPAADLSRFRSLQAAGPLRYGAWLGVRHRGLDETYKLYLEVPAGAGMHTRPYVERLLGRFPTIKDRPISLCMIGYYPHNRTVELYFRVRQMRSWELHALLTPLGLEARATELLDALQQAYGRLICHEMPGETFGFSYALTPGRPAVFSLYTFAVTMFGGSARTRESVLRFARQRGWNLDDYAALSAPLAQATGRGNLHGMFGLAIAAEQPLQMHIGLRPPGEAA